jgi:hypothetical protein
MAEPYRPGRLLRAVMALLIALAHRRHHRSNLPLVQFHSTHRREVIASTLDEVLQHCLACCVQRLCPRSLCRYLRRANLKHHSVELSTTP